MGGQVVSVTQFKAKCLSLLEEVSTKGGTITVTKRGQPVATVNPVKKRRFKSTRGILEGTVDIPDEVLMADRSDFWEALREKETRGL